MQATTTNQVYPRLKGEAHMVAWDMNHRKEIAGPVSWPRWTVCAMSGHGLG